MTDKHVKHTIKTLTTWQIAKESHAIKLGFDDDEGNPISVTIPITQASALLLTLPRMIKAALRAWGDASSRMAHPLKKWRLEYSDDPSFLILTLEALEDFDVCFKISLDQLQDLGGIAARSNRNAVLN